MKTIDLFKKFIEGATSGKASSCFIDGNAVYSYGKHFPLAIRVDNVMFVNESKYSVTTSKHQSWLEQALNEMLSKDIEIKYRDQVTMRNIDKAKLGVTD